MTKIESPSKGIMKYEFILFLWWVCLLDYYLSNGHIGYIPYLNPCHVLFNMGTSDTWKCPCNIFCNYRFHFQNIYIYIPENQSGYIKELEKWLKMHSEKFIINLLVWKIAISASCLVSQGGIEVRFQDLCILLWVVGESRILAIDHLVQRGNIVPCCCCMRKKARESIDYLLLHCEGPGMCGHSYLLSL